MVRPVTGNCGFAGAREGGCGLGCKPLKGGGTMKCACGVLTKAGMREEEDDPLWETNPSAPPTLKPVPHSCSFTATYPAWVGRERLCMTMQQHSYPQPPHPPPPSFSIAPLLTSPLPLLHRRHQRGGEGEKKGKKSKGSFVCRSNQSTIPPSTNWPLHHLHLGMHLSCTIHMSY